MATKVLSKCRPIILNHAISTNTKTVPSKTASLVLCREYRPYMVIPKAFLKPKDRNKKKRDDVYFVADQVPLKHSINDAADCMRAYSLFGPEPIDILLKINMGEKKVNRRMRDFLL